MFKNSEGYADPTAGSVLAHIAREERQRVREAYRAVSDAVSRERGDIRLKSRVLWVKVWPKGKSTGSVRNGGMKN